MVPSFPSTAHAQHYTAYFPTTSCDTTLDSDLSRITLYFSASASATAATYLSIDRTTYRPAPRYTVYMSKTTADRASQ